MQEFFLCFLAHFCFFLTKNEKKKKKKKAKNWAQHVGQCSKSESTYSCMWACETNHFFLGLTVYKSEFETYESIIQVVSIQLVYTCMGDL